MESTEPGLVESGADETPRKHAKRTNKACLNCRARKTRCNLETADGTVQTPCLRCKRESLDCVIGGSNRGGRRVRRSMLLQSVDLAGQPISAGTGSQVRSELLATPKSHGSDVQMDDGPPIPPCLYENVDPSLRTLSAPAPTAASHAGLSSSSSGSEMPFANMQNPSDALDILAQIASDDDRHQQRDSQRMQRPEAYRASKVSLATPNAFDVNLVRASDSQHTVNYRLVQAGKLTVAKMILLLQRYKYYYHPYFPLVPSRALDATNLPDTARDWPHLLTAILVIASKDLLDEPHLFGSCTEHMQSLVSALAAGGACGVEAVEALLILAEWTPYTQRSQPGQVGRGEEDREAWMHVGTALRVGYFLGLDRYSFRVYDDAKDPEWQRKRLVWTACYISDRQISIRIGRAFWSRGPGPLTTLRKEDFPSLHPQAADDEDYASIFQATLELTMLFSNVHDVLYSNPGSSMRSHLSGGYIKYIDDFRSAIYGWKSVWGTLTCSSSLKATLLMSYDYLRLYTNAFAFHATVRRALPATKGQVPQLAGQTIPGRVFYNNVGAVGDARFIYEGLDAAKSLLTTVNNFVDPERMLRYMPLRFYLYTIYSGVFLYRARCVGVMSEDEERSVRNMVRETVSRLERASVSTQHVGSRYSQLLKLLWDKVDRKSRKESRITTTLEDPYRPGSLSTMTPGSIQSQPAVEESPAVTEQMGDFSWTDLDAIGNFALNGNGGVSGDNSEWWTNFLPTDAGGFGALDGFISNDEPFNLGF
ncbi:hypothetical protein LTR66_005167 [Elasticomyces elasticus]|nr:hypothetical protein LTR66_005167 [Elasticomyces elasticus]